MDSHAIEEIRGSTAKEGELLSQWDQIRFPGLNASMSMSDLVNHIGNCISEQMTSSSDDLQSRDILEEITQYLLNDSKHTSASDEQCLMSRVNSLCCLLQKDSAVAPNFQTKEDDAVDVHNYGKNVEGSSVSASARDSKTSEGFPVFMDESHDVSGSKRPQAMTRKDSVGDLLHNLPRDCFTAAVLFNIMEDSDTEAR